MSAKIIPLDFKLLSEANFDNKAPSEAFKRGVAIMKVIYEKPVNCVWLRLGVNHLLEKGLINLEEAKHVAELMGFGEEFWL